MTCSQLYSDALSIRVGHGFDITDPQLYNILYSDVLSDPSCPIKKAA